MEFRFHRFRQSGIFASPSERLSGRAFVFQLRRDERARWVSGPCSGVSRMKGSVTFGADNRRLLFFPLSTKTSSVCLQLCSQTEPSVTLGFYFVFTLHSVDRWQIQQWKIKNNFVAVYLNILIFCYYKFSLFNLEVVRCTFYPFLSAFWFKKRPNSDFLKQFFLSKMSEFCSSKLILSL